MPSEAEMPQKPLPLTLIVAATQSNGIGQGNKLPWRLKNEMGYFARVTSRAPEGTQNAVVMGRKSWEGIPKKFRPLKGRSNVVISRGNGREIGTEESVDTQLVDSLPAACSLIASSSGSSYSKPLHRAFLIGGAQLYSYALTTPSPSYRPERILLTRVLSPSFPDCDVFFPEIRPDRGAEAVGRWEVRPHDELREWTGEDVPEGEIVEGDVKYRFEMWTREGD